MTNRPQRVKATRLHGPVLLEHQPYQSEGHTTIKAETATKAGQTATDSVHSTAAGKAVKKRDAGLNQNVSKSMADGHLSNRDRKQTHDLKADRNDIKTHTVTSNGLPKGFATRKDMEVKVKRHRSGTSQSSEIYQTGPGMRKSDEFLAQKDVPQGHVTKKDMEAKLKNRKTVTTKVSPVYTEKDVIKLSDEKQSEKTSVVRRKNIPLPDRKVLKPFSILESKRNVNIAANTEMKSKQPPNKDNKDIVGGKGEKKITHDSKVTVHSKRPLPAAKSKSEQNKQTKDDTGKPKNFKEDKIVNGLESASTSMSNNSKTANQAMSTRNTSTAIPKTFKRDIGTKNSTGQVILPSVKILIMNANGRDDKGGSPAERRKNAIQNVVSKHMPHITLFQEFAWSGITGKAWSKYPFPEQYVYKGHYEASLMYDDNVITVQDLPATDLDTILKGLYANSNNRLKRTFPIDFTPLSRLCICRVTAPTKPGLDFICISWHGRSNDTGGGRMKELKKIEYFEYWMEFLRNIREKYKLPILAAGDYNVDMYSIEKCVESPFKLCLYEASMRRTVRGIVDYCIVTEDLDFSDITWVNLERDTTVFHPNGILDHDPIMGMLSVSALITTGAAMGFGKKKAWPSPIAKVK